jgi:hypothetical protein
MAALTKVRLLPLFLLTSLVSALGVMRRRTLDESFLSRPVHPDVFVRSRSIKRP